MNPADWARVQRILDAALDMSPPERAEYLDRACAGDAEIRHQVEALINADDKAGSFLSAAIGGGANSVLARSSSAGPGTAVGRYRVRRLIGEGGMGSVFEAEQDRPRRKVALKVIRAGFATGQMLRRFELEAQALGRLQHPGIARIYEAGTSDTDSGPQPYFAMEFIDGQPLVEFAQANHLDMRQRFEIMAKVCDAVDHAHQRGIIHRDLKPGNILVDGAGQPKILDFGVARLTDSEARLTTQTDVGQLIGTLTYMSPEQVLADPNEIDTRSDVYSLGVILYELLTGRLPYDTSGRPIHEAVAVIRSSEPTSLSSISRVYRGDVETIVGKALEKDKSRRYGSAASLAEDIQRYLNDEPITARPPTAAYQLRKFTRRHRPLVLGTAAAFFALVAGIVVSTYQAVRAGRAERTATQERDKAAESGKTAGRERDRAVVAEALSREERNAALTEKQRADTERAAAIAVTDFLRNDLLAQASAKVQSDRGGAADPDLKVRTALDRASAHIGSRFEGRPEVESSIRQTIAQTYIDLGLTEHAEPHVQRATDLLRNAFGEEHPSTLSAVQQLALVYREQGKYTQAEQLLAKVIDKRRRLSGEQHAGTLQAKTALAVVYNLRGKYGQTEQLLPPLVDVYRRVFGEDHRETLGMLNALATAYTEQGKYSQAEPINSRVLELYRSAGSESHPLAIMAMNNLANNYDRQGKYDKAEPLLVQVVELGHAALGDEHPNTLLFKNNLADLQRKTGRPAEAEVLYNEVLATRRRVLGDQHPDTLITMMSLGRLYRVQGQSEMAAQLFAQVLEIRRRILGGEHPYTLISLFELGRTYERQGKFAEAEQLHARLVDSRRRVLGLQNLSTLEALRALGRVRLAQQKYAEAEATLRECFRISEKTIPNTWQRFAAQGAFGASLAGRRQYEEAEALLLAGYRGMLERQSTIPVEDQSALEQTRTSIADLYDNWGRPEQAAKWRQASN